jgi:hypothetical protein
MNALLLCAALSLPAGGDDATKPPPPFMVMTRRENDVVAVSRKPGEAVFTVTSPSGISAVTIERTGETWPASMVLRLRLKGLSSFRATGGKVRLDAAVSVQGGKPAVRVWKDGKEDAPLGEKDPLRLAVRVVGKDGKPATKLPLEGGGYFEVKLPRAFFAGNPKFIKLEWIDFYRR